MEHFDIHVPVPLVFERSRGGGADTHHGADCRRSHAAVRARNCRGDPGHITEHIAEEIGEGF